MSKLLKWLKRNIPLVLTILFTIFLILKNLRREDFFDANFVDIVTILIVGMIPWYLTEENTDDRRRKDCIEHIILEIEEMILSDDIFLKEKRIALSKQSSCANRIKYLKDANFQDIEKEVEFISAQFEQLRNLYSDHIENPNIVDVDFRRIQGTICDKCNKIRIGLYC